MTSTEPAQTSDDGWHDAASMSGFDATDAFGVAVGGRRIALFQVEGDLYATDDICSHGEAFLCEGFLEGHEIECPRHQGRFDVRTGEATCPPAERAIETFPVRRDGDRIRIRVAA